MKTVACYKATFDNQDIEVKPDLSVGFDRAATVIGEYDLVAIEEAVRLAEATEGECVLLTAGDAKLNDTKLTKAALSRGAKELFRVEDAALTGADSLASASALAGALRKMEFDVVLCGEGSGDFYSQQVGALVGSMLDVPVVNAVSRIECKDGALLVERALEGCVEVLEVSLPAVVSVTSDANLPRIPQLKDILAAGKKPVTVWSLDEVGGLTPSGVEVRDVWAPEGAARKNVVYEGCTPESISALAADVRAAL